MKRNRMLAAHQRIRRTIRNNNKEIVEQWQKVGDAVTVASRAKRKRIAAGEAEADCGVATKSRLTWSGRQVATPMKKAYVPCGGITGASGATDGALMVYDAAHNERVLMQIENEIEKVEKEKAAKIDEDIEARWSLVQYASENITKVDGLPFPARAAGLLPQPPLGQKPILPSGACLSYMCHIVGSVESRNGPAQSWLPSSGN